MEPFADGLMQLKVYQGFAVHRSFLEAYPERYETFVSAYRSMLESEGYQRFADQSGINRNWVGPEMTDGFVRSGFELQSRYRDLLQ